MQAPSLFGGWTVCRGVGSLGLALLSWQVQAQAPPTSWSLKVTPQYIVLSGLWLEAEQVRAGHPSQTFTLAPQLYWGPTGRPDVQFTRNIVNHDEAVRGAGLQVQHRFYLSKAGFSHAFPTGFYLGYSPQVQFFRLGFSRNEWHEETSPYGLPYLIYGGVRYHETVVRYGLAGQAGYQFALSARMLLDVYAGVGVRKSHYRSEFAESQYQSGPSDYAHEGVYFPAGFKLGIAMR
jgi:hypothetical protein